MSFQVGRSQVVGIAVVLVLYFAVSLALSPDLQKRFVPLLATITAAVR